MKAKNFWYITKGSNCGKPIWVIVDGCGKSIADVGDDDCFHYAQDICNQHNITHLEDEDEYESYTTIGGDTRRIKSL